MFSDITHINESHQLVHQLTQQLRNCDNHDVSTSYGRLLDWTEQVFGTEQRLMEKHAFPAIQCHLEQHARVLCAMHRAHTAVMRGDHALGRHVGASLLPSWFELHNATLDAAMLLWISGRISFHQHEVNHSSAWLAPRSSHLESRSMPAPWSQRERRSQPRI